MFVSLFAVFLWFYLCCFVSREIGVSEKGMVKMRIVIVPLVWFVYPLVLVIALEIRKINETNVFFGK